jgi:hypothetical protein
VLVFEVEHLAGETNLGALLDPEHDEGRQGRGAVAGEQAASETQLVAALNDKRSLRRSLAEAVTWTYQNPWISQSGDTSCKTGVDAGRSDGTSSHRNQTEDLP